MAVFAVEGVPVGEAEPEDEGMVEDGETESCGGRSDWETWREDHGIRGRSPQVSRGARPLIQSSKFILLRCFLRMSSGACTIRSSYLPPPMTFYRSESMSAMQCASVVATSLRMIPAALSYYPASLPVFPPTIPPRGIAPAEEFSLHLGSGIFVHRSPRFI